MQPTRNTFMQTRRALCHSLLERDEENGCTRNVQISPGRTISVHLRGIQGAVPFCHAPNNASMHARWQTLKPRLSRAALESIAAFVLILTGLDMAHSQAPIRERSEPVSGIDGARRAADTARSGLVAADTRQAEATARVKKAEDSLLAAQKEIEAARSEKAAADRAQVTARSADENARAALARALDARK